MKNDDLALFRYSIIGPWINGTSGCDSINSFCKNAAKEKYYFCGKYYVFSFSTLEKWIKRYSKNGFDGLKDKKRNDKNKPRVMDDDITIRIVDLKTQFPRMTGTSIYKKLVEEHYIDENEISDRSVRRFIEKQDFTKLTTPNERKSYAFEHPNDSWQTDTTSGPYIIIKGLKYKTYIIVFIDDHSRMIVGCRAFFNDTAINMQEVLKEAILNNGIPRQIYADNGGPYSNKQLEIICARLGIVLRNARPYDPQSKGKVERFNRSMKDRWMNTINWNEIESLEDLNNKLETYITEYNKTVHTTTNKTPADMYFEADFEARTITKEDADIKFRHTITRKVNNTGCISIEKRKYELDYSLAGKKVDVTYDPWNPEIIYYNEKAYTYLDEVKNSKKKRKKNIDYSKIVNKENEEILEYEPE